MAKQIAGPRRLGAPSEIGSDNSQVVSDEDGQQGNRSSRPVLPRHIEPEEGLTTNAAGETRPSATDPVDKEVCRSQERGCHGGTDLRAGRAVDDPPNRARVGLAVAEDFDQAHGGDATAPTIPGMADHCLILVSCGSDDEAREIARELVGAGHAAGVQVVPISSIYRWKGEVVEDAEWLLVIKTTAERYDQVEATVLAMHSYEVPQVIMIGINRGHQPYLTWLESAG
jgi:periplasmic divalent cation tolerance protein